MQFEQNMCTQFSSMNINYVEDTPEERIKCPIVKQCVKKIIEEQNYTSYTINNNTLPADLGNYVADLVEIDIKGKTKDGDNEDCIFVKHIVRDEGFIKEVLNVDLSYEHEIFAYSELQNVFNELYEEAGVPEEQRLRTVKCYDCNNHVIILENLSRKGFKILPRLALTPLEFAIDTLKQLAKFHALSFALEYKRKDFFEKKIKPLRMPMIVVDENGNITDSWKNLIIKMLNQSIEHDTKNILRTRKEKLIEDMLKKLPKYFSSNVGSIKCMCHGDFKPNNILFKKVAEEEVETIIIDYQIINYSSPVVDIICFLYCGTDRPFRKTHMENLKDIYYETLTNSLRDFNLQVDKIYPRSVFEKDFKDCLEYGVFLGLSFVPLLFTEDPKFFKSNHMDGDIPKTNDTFKSILDGVLEDLIELKML